MGVEVGAKKKSLSCLQLKDCTQFTLSLRIVDPSHVRVARTRLAPGQVFWLSDHPTCRAFPSRSNVTVANLRLSSPITAAGPLPTSTGFPIKPFRVPKLCCLLLLQGGGKKQEKKGLFHRLLLIFAEHQKRTRLLLDLSQFSLAYKRDMKFFSSSGRLSYACSGVT
jgi:hypothetical protein